MEKKVLMKHFDIKKDSKLFKLFVRFLKVNKLDLYYINKSIIKDINYVTYHKDSSNVYYNINSFYNFNIMRYSFIDKNSIKMSTLSYYNNPIMFYMDLLRHISFKQYYNRNENYNNIMQNVLFNFKKLVYNIYDVNFYIKTCIDIFDIYKNERTQYKHYMEYCLGRKIKNKTDFINVIKENIIRQINNEKHRTVLFYFFDGNDYKIFNNKFKTISKINNFINYHIILAILNDNFKEIKAEDIRKTNEYKKFVDKTLPF